METNWCVMVTSAGVASAVNVMNALRLQNRRKVRIVAGDMDPLAPGLHIADSHHVLPPVKDPDYIGELTGIAKEEGATALIPIYSGEIELISGRMDVLRRSGIGCLVASRRSLGILNDKEAFGRWLEKEGLPHPESVNPDDIDFPVFIKPRRGSSSKGAKVVENQAQLDALDLSRYVIQEYVPGTEVTIDFLVSPDGELLAAVPRERIQVKDGKAVKARTIEFPEGIRLLEEVVRRSGFVGPGNMQIMRGEKGPVVIEVNPRFAAGGLPLATAAGPNMPYMLLELLHTGDCAPHMEYERGLYMSRYLTEVFLRKDESGFKKV